MAAKPGGVAAALAALDADPLSFLTDDGAAFLNKNWERGPAVIRASAARRALFDGLFCWGSLRQLAGVCQQEGEPLEFGVDVNAARYVDGRRETPNGEVADVATLEQLYRAEGCTMQVHQPQRFSEEIWRLLAALEAQLGCLVGCNAYLTPAGTQGLAPHWDDVEIWVVQTEGSKRWRLYAPKAPAGAEAGAPGAARARLLASCHLANQVSGDLDEDDIGEPVMEFTLEVGDVLYMPRGTIHQAAAQGEGDSAHLTISTYQRWSAADLLQYTVSVALANPELQPLLPAPLKAGLPPRWLAGAGMGAAAAASLAAASGGFEEALPALLEMAQAQGGSQGGSQGDGKRGGKKAGKGAGASSAAPTASLARQLAAACRALADCLEGGSGEEGQGLGPRLIQTAADAMAEDFMRSRLPPHPEQLLPRGPAPTLEDAVQCAGAGLFRLVPLRGTEGGHDHGCGSDCEEDHEHPHPRPHGHHHPHEHGDACGPACHEGEAPQAAQAAPGPAPVGSAVPPAWVRLVSCLRNDVGTHMMAGGGEEEEEEEEESGSESDSEGSEEGGSSGDEEDEQDEQDGSVAEVAEQEKGSEDEEEGEEGEEEGEEGEEEEEEVMEFGEGGAALAKPGAASVAAGLEEQIGRLAAAAGRKRKQLEEEEEEEEEGDEEEEGSEEDDDEEDDDDDDEEEGSDSDSEEEQEDLVFPAEFAPALVQLLATAPDAPGGPGRPLPVCAIALPDAELQLQVAAALWDAGVLCTAPPPPKPKAQPKPKQQKQKEAAAGKQQGQAAQGKAGMKAGKAAGAAAEKMGKAKPTPAVAGGGKKQAGGGKAAAAGPKPKKHKA